MSTPRDLHAFWFAHPDKHFARDEAFDAALRTRFAGDVEKALAGAYDAWANDTYAFLPLLLLLDQLPRNLFRGTARAFAGDERARDVASRAVARGFDLAVPARERLFVYLPFEHSESLSDQERSLQLFATLGDHELMRYARAHHELIARFGRFPHRNEALGRASTSAERAHLAIEPNPF